MKQKTEPESFGLIRPWTIGMMGILVVLASSLVALPGSVRDFYSEYQINRLIEPAYSRQRPGGGRLFGATYNTASTEPVEVAPRIGEAQRLLLAYRDSALRRELQSRIHLASENWTAAAATLEELLRERPQDPAALNNLGVAYLALGETDGTYLLRAFDQFQTASLASPTAPEPKFNTAIVFRKLRLPHLAKEAEDEYAALDGSSTWQNELGEMPTPVEVEQVLSKLKNAIDEGWNLEASQLVRQYPDLSRRIAMSYGLGNSAETEALARFIGQEFSTRYGDKTISAMLDPLFTTDRQRLLAARQMVQEGARLYIEGDLTASIDAYAQAEDLVEPTGSLFDRYWIDLNRVDTLGRMGRFEEARAVLEKLIAGTKDLDLRWLLARGLSIHGSANRLSPSFKAMMDSLTEAEHLFVSIGASDDTVRPLYYLAVYKYSAGDYDEALRLAFKCLNLTDEQDDLRKASLYRVIASVLYRQGQPARSAWFASASLEQAEKTGNPSLVSNAASMMAMLSEANGEESDAEQYLALAEDASDAAEPGGEKTRAELALNLINGRMQINRKRYEQAESLLRKNLTIYSQLPIRLGYIHAPSLMLLGRVLSETGRLKEASAAFRGAIEVAENDDAYLQDEKSRVAFDDERRELYDSAIAFEYDQGATDAAWNYVQRYRAKLFLEFLVQFNPRMEHIRSEALSRAAAQKLIPEDAQVVEYALMKDRLLIWVASRKQFTVRSVNVSREQLEQKVQAILERLRGHGETRQVSGELFEWLVAPVADLLDPKAALAIIPDRALHSLPFGAIRNAKTGKYLIEDYSILVSPSLTYLLASKAATPERDALVSFGAQTGEISESRELTALSQIYMRSEAFTGPDVNKPKFLEAMRTAPVFHYAGHSATEAADPLRSSILLDGNRYGPNSVTAVDIAQQRLLPNALVILSSCDSSVGNARDGVGMRGLTSAFLIGGAGVVVGSLWPVETTSTSNLMVNFHREFVSSKLPVAQALRNAQLRAIRDRAEHPYYWSSFVVTGNFSALR